jgi:hypothetical protein
MELKELLKNNKHSFTKGALSQFGIKDSIYSYLGEKVGDFFTKGELDILDVKTRFNFDDKSFTSKYQFNKDYGVKFDVNKPNPAGHFKDDYRISLTKGF